MYRKKIFIATSISIFLIITSKAYSELCTFWVPPNPHQLMQIKEIVLCFILQLLALFTELTCLWNSAIFQLQKGRNMIEWSSYGLETICINPSCAPSIVIHALVISHLDYCNAHYVGLPLKAPLQKLQLLQNVATDRHILVWLYNSEEFQDAGYVLQNILRLPVSKCFCPDLIE